MRKQLWLGVAAVTVVAALAIAVTIYLQRRESAKAVTLRIEPPVLSVAPLPPPPAPAANDLPSVEVPQHPVHAVREDPPAAGPSEASPPPQAAPPSVALPPLPARLTGAAQAAGGTTLTVQGRPLRLFGVRPPDDRDRCPTHDGALQASTRPCAEVAHEALAARLVAPAGVNCRVPEGQRGQPAAICLDSTGVDLGGFLVGEGLAFADPHQSYDYVGAETVARTARRGLWRYR